MLLMYRTSYTSWQLKYTFFLCRYRKQFCQQRQSLRTWSGILNISCTNMFFYTKAAVTCQRPVPLGTDALRYLSRRPVGAAPAPAPRSSMERVPWYTSKSCSVQTPGLLFFVLIFINGFLFMWLRQARWFSVWTVAICTPKSFFACKKDIFNIRFLSVLMTNFVLFTVCHPGTKV